MIATFEQVGTHEPVVVLTPDYGVEELLLAAFLRYDANLFTVSVERREDGRIARVVLRASQAT